MEPLSNKCRILTGSDEVKQNGIVGRIAGFNVIEWNDETPNLAMLAGHPRFATRATEFSVPVHIQDLSQSGKYIEQSEKDIEQSEKDIDMNYTAWQTLSKENNLSLTIPAGEAVVIVLD